VQVQPQIHQPVERPWAQPELPAELPQVQPRLEEQVPTLRPLPAADDMSAVPVASAAPAAAPAPAAQPRFEEAAPGAGTPPVDPSEYLASAGLQMVETKPGIAPMRVPEAETVQPGRPRRERSPAPAQEELVQIETRK
jgi:hypothetical protein